MSTRTRRGTSLLESRARALGRQLPLALEGDGKAVHQARVASRRLREALPVLSAGLKRPKKHKTARKIRKLTRALGAVRELDVTLQLLEELATAEGVSPAAVHEIRLHVDAERTRRRDGMLEEIGSVDPEKLERKLAAFAIALNGSRSGAWRGALASRLLKRARHLTDRLDGAGQLYAPEQLHHVRIATKKLRYGLELAADSGMTAAAGLVATLKRAQTTLGKLHDLQVLQAHVVAVQVAAPGRAPHEGLAAIAGRIEEQCRRLHGRYIRAVPELRAVAAAVRDVLVPRIAHGTRPLKMALPRRRIVAAGARA